MPHVCDWKSTWTSSLKHADSNVTLVWHYSMISFCMLAGCKRSEMCCTCLELQQHQLLLKPPISWP